MLRLAQLPCTAYLSSTSFLRCTVRLQPLRHQLPQSSFRAANCTASSGWMSFGTRSFHTSRDQNSNQTGDKHSDLVTSASVASGALNSNQSSETKDAIQRENIYTIPNALSVSRVIAAPVIGYMITAGMHTPALWLLAAAGITDVLDGWIARRWPSQQSVIGTALDPFSDKVMMTVLTVSLGMSGLLPLPLAGLIIFRDVGLLAGSFLIRYRTLPPPVTWKRYFDFSMVTAEVHPTLLSKANTVLQVALLWISLGAPVFGYTGHVALTGLCYVVGATTFGSGLSYYLSKDAIQIRTKYYR